MKLITNSCGKCKEISQLCCVFIRFKDLCDVICEEKVNLFS